MQTYTSIPTFIPPFIPPDYPTTTATVPPQNRHLAPVALICAAAVLLLVARRGARPKRTTDPLASDKDTSSAATEPESASLLSAWNLTPRQCEVAQLILEHHDYRDIGRLCGVSLRTVQDDASRIFRAAAVEGRRDFERFMVREAPKCPTSPEHP